jgi:hypothetical protein
MFQRPSAQQIMMLAEVYGWFVEGFGTKDLQEAKALLDSLESRVSCQNGFKVQQRHVSFSIGQKGDAALWYMLILSMGL